MEFVHYKEAVPSSILFFDTNSRTIERWAKTSLDRRHDLQRLLSGDFKRLLSDRSLSWSYNLENFQVWATVVLAPTEGFDGFIFFC